MKCHIDKDGYLRVSAETETELYAFETWWSRKWPDGSSNLAIGVELDEIPFSPEIQKDGEE
jgi:hypothetical protein